jgi:hypothetical protein
MATLRDTRDKESYEQDLKCMNISLGSNSPLILKGPLDAVLA